MRISDWSSDVCSSDLISSSALVDAAVRRTSSVAMPGSAAGPFGPVVAQPERAAAAISDSEISVFMAGCLAMGFGRVTHIAVGGDFAVRRAFDRIMLWMERGEAQQGEAGESGDERAEEQTAEIQSLMSISYDVFCL